MGIHGIYKEIGPGKRIALSKVAVEHFERTGRPLRIAVDISIWLFQIQSSKGGTNPALRTFYYRLLRLISLSIHPLFVFDGPNKPPFKRNRRTGPNVASIPEFLAKQLLKQFGLPFHLAPGEAEAECALLQREGIVDAVLSEDVDTLMFGSGITFRSWTPEAAKSKVPTHVNLYDAAVTKETSGMDREGMILVALMSGGDYVPEGIPGCGPKTASEAARAGFGSELCRIARRDTAALRDWRERLSHELHTNESKFFRQKHKKLAIPDDFPNPEVLGYYAHPVLSSKEKLEKLRRELRWDMDIDFGELRNFTRDAFDWTKLGGAKKFIRNLAPALLVRELRMQAEALAQPPVTNVQTPQRSEQRYLKGIHGKRNHASTDGTTELRITFTPHELVPIDLDAEEPDDQTNNDSSDDDEGVAVVDVEALGSPSKRRPPSNYDPLQAEKVWIFETYVRSGAPAIMQEWEERTQTARVLSVARNANREVKRVEREKKAKGSMQKAALDRYAIPSSSAPPALSTIDSPRATQRHRNATQPARKKATKSTSKTTSTSIQQFARVTKPGMPSIKHTIDASLPPGTQTHRWLGDGRLEVFKSPDPDVPLSRIDAINLISSSPPPAEKIKNPSQALVHDLLDSVPELQSTNVTKRRRSPLRRCATDTDALDRTGSTTRPISGATFHEHLVLSSPTSLPSPSQIMPAAKKSKPTRSETNSKATHSTPKHPKTPTNDQPISLLTSSPARQTQIMDYFTPRRRAAEQRKLANVDGSPLHGPEVVGDTVDALDLTGSPTPKARRPPRRIPTPPVMQDETTPEHHSDSSHSESRKSPPLSIPAHSAMDHCASRTRKPPGAKVKQIYRVRESLPGAFAVEELDLTKDIGTELLRLKKGKKFRKSTVRVLDLTGD